MMEIEVQPLTTRERQVAELVSEGCDTRTISHELGICERVAKSYRARIYCKLGIPRSTDPGRDSRARITLGYWWTCELFQVGLRELNLV